MKKSIKLHLLFLLLFAHTTINAQLSVGGLPFSFTTEQGLNNNVPIEIMPSVNVDSLLESDSSTDFLSRFGYAFSVNLNLENSGIWETMPNGDKVWRLKINCPNAFSVNLIFDNWWLPQGGVFFVYSNNKKMILGGFNDSVANNDENVFATDLIKGDTIILEYFEPNYSDGGVISIGKVIHGYKDMFGMHGRSGECNNDVNCSFGDEWCIEKQSIGLILLLDNTRLCSGCLINNTSQDLTPYFLTANHCLSGGTGTWLFRFKYWSPHCNEGNDALGWHSILGATIVANNAATDFALLRLKTTPPSSFGLVYAGWDRSSTPPTRGTAIHHPRGDVMKISHDLNSLQSVGWTNPTVNHWRATFDEGIVQHGSSGSPLFNQNHRIVGQLHGNQNNQCAISNNDCHCNQTPIGEYGMFHISWDGGGTAATRLRDWLDPNETDIPFLDNLKHGNSLYSIVSGAHHNYAHKQSIFTHQSVSILGKMYVNGDLNSGASSHPQDIPDNNSFFVLRTDCATEFIEIEDDAELIIGATTRGLKGELIINAGTVLRLKTGSELVINDNSKLVIEAGGRIEFHPNAQIILNGNNAILEIRGNLEIINGATFTVTGGANGMGKIIFNKNWTPDQPDYVGGNGNFVLNGTSKNTPHIEIYGNIGLKFGYGLNKVEIKNTEIIIDQPSTLCFLNNITKMENVKVSPINGMRHGGIKAVNRSQHFRNVDIYFAKTGITVFNNGYNGSMLLQDVTVSHSDYGIHAVGGCRINHNKGGLNNIGLTAFLGSGLLGNSGVRGVGISRDITFPMVVGGRVGLNVQGYAGGVFDIRRNTVVDFQTGVSVNNSRADLRCNNIFFNQKGIFASDARLSLVRNNLSNNDHSWTQYGGTYHIENGLNYFHANDFYFEHWNLAVSQYKYSNPAYVYNTNTPQYFVPDAQNAWGNNPLTGHKPADGFSYNKDYYINSVGLYPPPEPIMGNLAQNTPLPYNNFSNTDVTACPEINTSSSPMGTTTSSDISKSPPPMTYNSGVINGGWGGDIPVDGGSADLVLNDIKNRIYDYNSIPDITSIVSNLSDILFYPYQMTETQVVLLPYVVNDDTLYVQDTIEVILIEEEALTSVLMNAYHLMLECVSRAHEVSSYELNDSFQLFYAVANTLLDNIDDLIILSQNNHFLWSAVPFNLYIDKTNIQRFVYELDNAQTTLTQATSYIALPFQQNIYERLSCILDAEISIRDSLTLPQDIESNHPCLFADYSNIPPMLQSMALSNKPLSNSKTDPTITIYPNPASKELFVQTAADAGTYFIYNIAGSLVAAGRLNDKRIDISELSEGLYFIRLNTAAQTYHAKFVVAKE